MRNNKRVGCYRPHGIRIRDQRWQLSTKTKCCAFLVLIVVFVLWCAYAVDRAYAQEQQMCRQTNSSRLGEEVRQRFHGVACSINVWCADDVGEEESFTCSINTLMSAEDIGKKIGKAWEEKAEEAQRGLCRYMGAQVLFVQADGYTVLTDTNGEYQLKLQQSRRYPR